jgi:hypothetical protein
MNNEPDWDILARFFLPEEEIVDFQLELYGNAYRRDQDTEPIARGDDGSDRLGEALRLLDGLDAISETRRSGGVEGQVPTRTYSSRQKTEEAEAITSRRSNYPIRAMSGVQERSDPGRRERGAGCVPIMWPDPNTGCVYGGFCALHVRSDPEYGTCRHPQIQQSRAFSERDSPSNRRQQSSHRRRNNEHFAAGGRRRKDFRERDQRPAKTRRVC